MGKIYENIGSLIKSGRLSSAAETLGETTQKVSSAIDIILPSLLARLLKKGNSPEIRTIVEDAGKLKMYKDYNKIWDGNGIFDGKNIGERLENQLLGTSNPEFYSTVASRTGIGAENADRLTNWVAGTVAAYLGEKADAKKPYAEILTELGSEKDKLRADIPSNIAAILGLESLFAGSSASAKSGKPAPPKKKSYWWLWLLLAIILLAVIFFWRSCGGCKMKREKTEVATEQTATPPAAPDEIRITLPDGSHIVAFKGGCEECVMNFLQSDRFRNASDEELANTWFEFDNINFEHNSATEFMPGGERQVQNLAAILRNHPKLNIRIGAFADATGTRAVNFAITEKRAANIKAAFEKAGIDASRIATEGFGKDFAQIPANAPDSERALDRDIALRFSR